MPGRSFPAACPAGQHGHAAAGPGGGSNEGRLVLTIGGSIALIMIGAILRFAVTWRPANIDLQVVGLILMLGGVIGLVVSVAFLISRRRRSPGAQRYEERRYTEPPS